MINFKKMMCEEQVRAYLLEARYGVEREAQRIDLEGTLATTAHPEVLSKRDKHPYIQRDFAETQIELITPVVDKKIELMQYLSAIHDVAYQSIGKESMLWPLSMPPALPVDEKAIPIARLNNLEDVAYREKLSTTYGRRKQMISGVHFNFEFHDTLLKQLFALQSSYETYELFKTEVYMKVVRNYLQYRWVLCYFYGASPVAEANFFEEEALSMPVRSIRNSQYGYRNNGVQVSFESLEAYTETLAKMVSQGVLSEEKEFYAPIRLRGGQTVSDLKETGIRYIEIRDLDSNPFERNGISIEQVEVLHLFMLYMLWLDEAEKSDRFIEKGAQRTNQIALENPLQVSVFKDELAKMLDGMTEMLEVLGLSTKHKFIDALKKAVEQPTKTLAGRLCIAMQGSSQQQVAVALAKGHYETSWQDYYQLSGFEDMELSTQQLLFDAIQKGLAVEVIDRQDQFVKLTADNHVEYVKNGNMTSKDTYIATLMMENKTVTKKVLQDAGFHVPAGKVFTTIQEAQDAYLMFEKQAIVVKPKSTNYGLGISIFKEGCSYEDYRKAIEIAFAEDHSILIETFIEGTEYRFFVLDNTVRAVLMRVPANVKGNGKDTIAQLVAEKNEDPLRGTGHRTPLEKIQLGEIEKLMLKMQGYTIQSVLAQDEVVYLRENSNISTGGDSIDMTDRIPEDYKQIAVQATRAMGAAISGVDLIIPDSTVPAKQKGAYHIIEANFNPCMYMHMYPYTGRGRKLTKDVLDYLFPEIL